MIYYDCYQQKKFAKVILICTFCFMAFVQISELLKNSAAFAIFFYALTIYITKGNKINIAVYILISIGIHSSVIMLLPLFLYKLLNVRFALFLGIISFILSSSTNIVELLMSLLPNSGYFELLVERFEKYGEGNSGTTHYIAIQLTMLFSSLYLLYKNKSNEEIAQVVNIFLLYFVISNLNFYNLVAYLRLSILSHWLFAFIYICFYKGNVYSKKISKLLVIFMLLLTTKWTITRTISGGYCSSYMDNSIPKIILSTSYHYLSVDYEK